jgi:hypothetical protein
VGQASSLPDSSRLEACTTIRFMESSLFHSDLLTAHEPLAAFFSIFVFPKSLGEQGRFMGSPPGRAPTTRPELILERNRPVRFHSLIQVGHYERLIARSGTPNGML